MSLNLLVDISEAVKDALNDPANAAALVQTFTAVREYLKEIDLAELAQADTLDVRVYPGPVKSKPITRLENENLVTVKIAIRKKLATQGNAEIDPLMLFTQAVSDLFRGSVYLDTSPKAGWQSSEIPVPYFPEHLHKFGQFTSVINLTFRAVQ